jgi:hypothetical protein
MYRADAALDPYLRDAQAAGIAAPFPRWTLGNGYTGKVISTDHPANAVLEHLWEIFIQGITGSPPPAVVGQAVTARELADTTAKVPRGYFWIFKTLRDADYVPQFFLRADVERAKNAVLVAAEASPEYQVILEAAIRAAQNYSAQSTDAGLRNKLRTDVGAKIVLYLLLRHAEQVHRKQKRSPYQLEAVEDSDMEDAEERETMTEAMEEDSDSDDDDLYEANLRRPPEGGGANPGHDFTAFLPNGCL